MRLTKIAPMVTLFMLPYLFTTGQNNRTMRDQFHAWFMYIGDHKVSRTWGLHAEVQFRRADFVSSGQQLLLRTGINYHITSAAFFTAGYCFVETYPYGDFPVKATFPEHRIWEQFQFKTSLGRVEILSRYRLEQRFSHLPVPLVNGNWEPGNAVYTNRLRPLTRFSMPVNSKSMQEKSVYITVYEEPFISFGKNVGYNILDQNRAYAAFGYVVPKIGRLEIGYLNQIVMRPGGTQAELNHTLQIGLSSNVPWYSDQHKTTTEKIPGK